MAETSSYSRGPHPSQRRYPPELRERAVRMVQQAIEESGERVGVITRVARQLGIGTESLRSWVRQVEVDQGQRPGTSTQDKERIAALERPVRELRRSNEIGAAPSVGSVGDSYDNSLAESTIGLYKTELIRRHGPWGTLEEVELATLAYVDWFNHRRLHGQIGNLPPAELEATYYRQLGQAAVA
jgi:transposase